MYGSRRNTFPAQISVGAIAHSKPRPGTTGPGTPVHHNEYECPAPAYQNPEVEVEAAAADDDDDIELVQECIGSSWAPIITISRISEEFKVHVKSSPIFENENWRTTKTKRNRTKPNVIGVSSKDVEATWAEVERHVKMKYRETKTELEEKIPAYYFLLNMLLESKVERIDEELNSYNTTVWTISVLSDARKYLVFQGCCMKEMIHRYFEFECIKEWKLKQEQLASSSQGGTNGSGVEGIKNLI